MQTKDIISRLGGKSLGQVIRFGIVGVAATAIQAVLYQVLVGWLRAELANAIAYVVSFIFNYVASTRFTFRVKSSARRGAGFLLSHLINFTLQTLILHLSIRLGLTERWAMVPMFVITVPVNFLLVRFFLTRK
ncbi:MAG: GtrA family protein [Prevotella sp.]|nr:GtrA family protein [Prevotella sp.]MDD7336474.1 GtrA family protein [Prevotella sp.]MDY4626046.1 GtrA family protein [Prevotella sp.]MDY4667585.1 GtrA family protein [Prevotella sp.]MDY5258349.1 GtrA family protein [Prevotella sp.]